MGNYPSQVNSEGGHRLTTSRFGKHYAFYSDFGAAAVLSKEQVEQLRDELNEWLDQQ